MGTFLSVVVAVITIACRTDAAPGTSVTTTRVAIEFINTDMLPFFIARGLGDGYSNPSLFVERAEADGVVVTLEEHPGGHGFENTDDPDQQRIVGLALDLLVNHLLVSN